MGLTPLGCFSQKRRFENQKLTKTKKQALYFRLLLDLSVHPIELFSKPSLELLQKLNASKDNLD